MLFYAKTTYDHKVGQSIKSCNCTLLLVHILLPIWSFIFHFSINVSDIIMFLFQPIFLNSRNLFSLFWLITASYINKSIGQPLCVCLTQLFWPWPEVARLYFVSPIVLTDHSLHLLTHSTNLHKKENLSFLLKDYFYLKLKAESECDFWDCFTVGWLRSAQNSTQQLALMWVIQIVFIQC